MNLLVLAAFEPELAPLRSVVPRSWVLETVGIGIAEAAARTSLLLSALQPKHVLFVGSCGSSIATLPMLSLVSAGSAVLGDSALASSDGYLPEAVNRSYAASPQYLSTLSAASALTAPIYSPLSITSSQSLADQLRTHTGSAFENLELFGIAAACAAHGTGWNALCAITNAIGPDGHAEWKRNFARAADITSAALQKVSL